MRPARAWLACLPLCLGACDDAPSTPEAAPDAACDELAKAATNIEGPFACEVTPAFVSLGGFDVFTYEASHPLAAQGAAFPCADRSATVIYQAPPGETEPCSVAGVRPWHSVTWRDAGAACARIGWRLCTSVELRRACGGPGGQAYSYGTRFDAKACNVLSAWRAEDAQSASEWPTGHSDACESPDGVQDADGNLWEWVSDLDGERHVYQGAGWRLIAQHHLQSQQGCGEQVQALLPDFANLDVGFRCCRDRSSSG